jgi:hypothetical protein
VATRLRQAICATIGLLLWAAPAHAYSIRHEARGPTDGLNPSDTVTIDVFLEARCDADSCETYGSLSIAVLFEQAALTYDPVASVMSPEVSSQLPFRGGAQPSYILYASHHTVLYPQATPAFELWPDPPAGMGQVNVDYQGFQLPRISPYTFGSGDSWMATMVFHLESGAGSTLIALSANAGGTGITEIVGGEFVDPKRIHLSDPILFTVPEPATAALMLTGVAVWAALRPRRRAAASPRSRRAGSRPRCGPSRLAPR